MTEVERECRIGIAEEAALYFADVIGGYDDMMYWLMLEL